MEKIKPGKYVEITYDLYQINPDGTEKLVHQVDPADPEKFIFGVTRGMIEPLEVALDGLEAGGTYDVTVKADQAFGPYDPEQVVTLEKDLFVVDGKFDAEMVKPGALVPMMTADGFRINGLVKEVKDNEVVMDFNHPLAGKDVRFKGEVKTVRDATPEELQPAHGCGCGCHDHGCSDDGCGCDHGHCGDDACGCH
ncbi:MAG: FKBP-type peptidyl-prolyl cis-trans isomerase [Muribaculaceae bacterium]|nr:peptidylprolyl isomerase [Barnesiella sp.]MDE6317862.1 FKBP-type peptidyl-prolyl cis-trans isomerase [Muribaculaceae bacterium]